SRRLHYPFTPPTPLTPSRSVRAAAPSRPTPTQCSATPLPAVSPPSSPMASATTEASAWVARVGADHAAEGALRCGSATQAGRDARPRRNLRDLGYPDYDPEWDYWPGESDTVLAVTVVEPGATSIRMAWVGDCRVYRLGHTGILQQVTSD